MMPAAYGSDAIKCDGAEAMTEDEGGGGFIWQKGRERRKGIGFRDLQSIFRTSEPLDTIFNFVMEAVNCGHEASAIILQTFYVLE
ncbi:hypothetical protein FNV43_RR14822 [Rhamnella rubrinervis]|uniref:Uncharacterized protein n=1 Tax=Rhamnella rubrinervis TaxID=2594499 RepID=A0A8K0MG61_9ROSA|nr:hypothetical protein FNV43_RR14822 [Rhamnella rubrinervis]